MTAAKKKNEDTNIDNINEEEGKVLPIEDFNNIDAVLILEKQKTKTPEENIGDTINIETRINKGEENVGSQN